MGCDIHCYVEYRKQNPVHDHERRWRPFGEHINPGRNYSAFGRLAGVRGLGPAVAEARGYPEDAGWSADEDFWIWIDYEGEGPEPGSRCCSPEKAAEWHKYGRRLRGSRMYGNEHIRKPTHIESPDWHTPSWVTADEWAQAIEGDHCGPEYRAMLASMRSLEADGYATRVVFWFDN